MRKKIFETIEPGEGSVSKLYDIAMIALIVGSLIPLAFHTENAVFMWVERISTGAFLFDYLLRWITADYKLSRGGLSFLVYPFTVMAIVDLVSVLPGLFAFNKGLKLLRLVRLFRAMRVLRVFKAARYSKNVGLILNVLRRQRELLSAVLYIAAVYVVISALVIFNAEPESFGTFFDAVYWAVVSLTTMGYGDIYPVTTLGRALTMISSIFGIAIVAMPAGIITAGFMEEMEKTKGGGER